jgi:hypothetical protein
MKATNKANGTKKVLITFAALMLSLTAVNAQGKLVETAAKLFSLNKQETITNEIQFINAGYAEETTSNENLRIRDMVFNRNDSKGSSAEVLEGFTTPSVIVGYEEELTTEAWMTESLSNELEPGLVTEEWMSESLAENMEPALQAESWMSEAFTATTEDALEAETWMAEPMVKTSNLVGGEQEINVEPWMLNLFNSQERINEADLVLEDWMTQPLNTAEQDLRVENWMVKPLF